MTSWTRIAVIASAGGLAALMSLATTPSTLTPSLAGAPVPVGRGATYPPRRDVTAPEDEQVWRERMDRLDLRARAELGVDDATSQRLYALQQRLRFLEQDIRDRAGAEGLDRAEVEARIRQRNGGFRAELGRLLGARSTQVYLRIIAETRAGS